MKKLRSGISMILVATLLSAMLPAYTTLADDADGGIPPQQEITEIPILPEKNFEADGEEEIPENVVEDEQIIDTSTSDDTLLEDDGDSSDVSVSPEAGAFMPLSVESSDFTYTVLNGSFISITGYTGSDPEVVIPDEIDGYIVQEIGQYAFYDCTSLTTISLPSTLTAIRQMAFSGCTGLTTVSLPNTLKTLDGSAFYQCASLTRINLPSTLTTINSNAFYGCMGLQEINLPSTLTTIGGGAFYGCTGLQEIDLPSTLTTIGNSAFSGCTGLTTVSLPDSVTTMGLYTFLNCTNLSSVNYPRRLTTVSTADNGCAYLFADCTKLKSITVPEGVTAIPDRTFSGSAYLQTVILPDTLTSIGNLAFYDCSGMEMVWINKNVVSIGSNTFQNCRKLTIHGVSGSYAETYANENGISFSTDSLVLISGKVVDENGNGVSGVSVSLYDTLNRRMLGTYYTSSAGKWVCVNARAGYTYQVRFHHPFYKFEVDIFNCVASSDGNVIPDVAAKLAASGEATPSSLFTTRIVNGTTYYAITGYTGGDTAVVIPDEIDGHVVRAIDADAFRNNTALTSVVLPTALQSLGDYAFQGCTNLLYVGFNGGLVTIGFGVFAECTRLTSISLPNSINTISGRAFYACTGLTTISLPSTLTTIGVYAFSGCAGLTSINLPNMLSTINNYAFSECTGLTTVSLPDSVTTMGYCVFQNCVNLKNINYPRGLTTVSNSGGRAYLFDGCTNLKSITVPEGVTAIPDYTFGGSAYLQTVILPDTLTSVGNLVFYNCERLTSITLPDNVTTIGNSAFFNCSGLTSITLPDRLTTIGKDVFNSCRGVKTVTIGESLTIISDNAFTNCKELTSIIWSENLTSIGSYAFYGCVGLVNIILPDGLAEIDSSAFYACENLTSITIPMSVTLLGSDVFSFCTKLTIHSDIASAATIYAIDNGIPCILTNDNVPDSPALSLNRAKTGYETNFGTVSSSGYIHMVLKYAFKESAADAVSDMGLNIQMWPPYYNTLENVTLNGSHISEFFRNENGSMTIPVSENIGILRISVKPLSYIECGEIVSYAQMTFKRDGVDKTEVIGVISQNISLLTLVANTHTVATPYVQISGVAPAMSVVALYVDGVNAGSVTASKAGAYSATVTLNNPVNLKKYKISVEANGNTADVAVVFEKNAPVLTQSKMLYSGTEYDLLNSSAEKPIISFAPGQPFTFTAKFLNPEAVRDIYIVSSRNNLQKYLTAKWDTVNQQYIATGYFDPANTNYVPGEISIYYSRPDSSGEEYYDVLSGADFRWAIDPSGYVYEAVINNRVQGVKVTAIRKKDDNAAPEQWGAAEFNQLNPLYTDVDGRYVWDVPEGLWQVKAEKDGYETSYSAWRPVPPPQTDVNIGLVSLAVPEIAWFNAYETYAEVEFTKYIQPETASNLILKAPNENAVPYALAYSQDEKSPDGTVYARRYKLIYENDYTASNGEYSLTIDASILSYAGVAAEVQTRVSELSRPVSIEAPGSFALEYGSETSFEILISGYDPEKPVTLEAESDFGLITSVKNISAIGEDGKAYITVSGNLPGSANINLQIPEKGIASTVSVEIKMDSLGSYEPPSGVAVIGLVASFNPSNPTTLQLLQDEAVLYDATIEPTVGTGKVEQSFTFPTVAPGTYTLVVTKLGHTKYTVQNIVVADTDVDLTQDTRLGAKLITLLCGDINGDGSINDADLTILWRAANYNKNVSVATDQLCDLDGSGSINDGDLTILWSTTNYNKGLVNVGASA
jgi:hypothetical protein